MSPAVATRVTELLTAARDRGLFSAAAWSVGDGDGRLAGGALGTDRWPERAATAKAVDQHTRFDLASVTKVVAGLAITSLMADGTLRPDSTVGELLPETAGSDKAALRLDDLLLHVSGMPGQVPLYRDHPDAPGLRRAVLELPLAGPPGGAVRYSSQGLMLAGWMAEAATRQGLDVLVAERVTTPVGARTMGFNPPPGTPTVATEADPWRGRLIHGEVHDENAAVLGGVAAHAGLFGSLADLDALGAALVRNLRRPGLLPVDLFARMRRNRTSHLGHGRGWSWQHVDAPDTPYGTGWGVHSFGHTGFTGTSLLVDPDAERYAVLLTNRVHPRRDRPGFADVRRAVHDLLAPA